MRTWFRYDPQYRAVRGGLIIDLQLALAKLGLLTSVDGIYANQTAQALRLWQAGKSLSPTGDVDELTWTGLAGTNVPALFRRCLALTASFEGHGYTLAVGNFDGAFLTWGIIGFTLKSGSLGDVIKRVSARNPALLAQTIGADRAQQLLQIIDAPAAQKEAWANSLSIGPNNSLRPDWRDAFEALGNQREVREAQDNVAHDRYWGQAVQDLRQFGQMTELDAALFFDTSVQNGGVDSGKASAIRNLLGGTTNLSTTDRLLLIAEAIASQSSEKYRADVMDRRGTIAKGSGTVHGANYSIASWGLGDFAIGDNDVA